MAYIETHGDALRLAVRVLNDAIELHEYNLSIGNHEAIAGTPERANEILKNHYDARDIIESDLLPEEVRWEEENGYAEDGLRIRGGQA